MRSFTKHLRLTLVFMGNVLRESLNYCCSKVFCYFSKKKNLTEKKTGHLAIIL